MSGRTDVADGPPVAAVAAAPPGLARPTDLAGRIASYASPPGSPEPRGGRTSAAARRESRPPPRLVQVSGSETRSGRSAATAASTRRRVWARLAALSEPWFICTTLTRIALAPARCAPA